MSIIEKMAREICEDSGNDAIAAEYMRDACDAMRAALKAAEEAGYVLVPKELTEEMLTWMDVFGVGETTTRGIWETGVARRPKVE